MVTASAPGKIILFGEHAVVYGRPALAVPVMQIHADVEVRDSSTPGIWVEAPGISLRCEIASLPATHPLAAVIESVLHTLGLARQTLALSLLVNSSIPIASGLGSGAAVSVALIRALSRFLGNPLPDEQVNALAYEIEKLHHGTPSGIDNTVITYARPVYFIKGQPIRAFGVAQPFTLIIADTGIPALTKESVGDLRQLWQADRGHWETVFDRVGEIVQAARAAIENGEIHHLGRLMDANQALLQTMTVSSPALDRLVLAAKQAGALGAKLSGGGRGGNMLALVQPSSAASIASALRAAGAQNTIITTIEEKA